MAAGYTLIAGTQNWSSWSLRPFVALKAIGAPFELIVLRLRRPESKEQILQYSSAGKVPVLKIAEPGRNLSVWDSLAICETLAERHPDAGLWPQDPAARALARAMAAEMHSGFPDLRDQLPMDFAGRKPLPELRDETKQQIVRIIESWSQALNAHGGEFLFGRLSIADCMYAPVASRFTTFGVELPQALAGYVERIMALPAMREWGEGARREVEAGLE
ncbi:MAG TPA: glutathione S-transferase family protein [Rhizomicrobium sp.]